MFGTNDRDDGITPSMCYSYIFTSQVSNVHTTIKLEKCKKGNFSLYLVYFSQLYTRIIFFKFLVVINMLSMFPLKNNKGHNCHCTMCIFIISNKKEVDHHISSPLEPGEGHFTDLITF
jgi:hypothetical protein